MALTDDNGVNATMLVSPTGGMGMNGGFGNGFNGDWGWIILLLLIAGGGWGNGFGGFGGNVGGDIYPWMNQSNLTTNGFYNSMLNDNITSIRDGVQGLATQLCNSTAGITQAINSGFASAEIADNARQIANMQTAFSGQMATMQGFNDVQGQLAQCCCDNRLATCQTQNIVQNEGNATRFADANNTRDIIDSQTRGTQAILDKLCQLELDGKNDRISELERELTLANLQASQTAQNAFIANGFANEVDALYNRLNNCPVPTTPVYGRTPIFTCNNNGCGCGCGNNF